MRLISLLILFALFAGCTYSPRGPIPADLDVMRTSLESQPTDPREVRETAAPHRIAIAPDEPAALTSLLSSADESHADWLLIYTLQTTQGSDSWLLILAVPTLGIFPNFIGDADTKGAAMIIDVRTRRVVDRLEVVEHAWQPANLWTLYEAKQDAAERVQPRAVTRVATFLEKALWCAAHPGEQYRPAMTSHPLGD